jgi:hypothetical protein
MIQHENISVNMNEFLSALAETPDSSSFITERFYCFLSVASLNLIVAISKSIKDTKIVYKKT